MKLGIATLFFILKNLFQVTQFSCEFNNLAPEGCVQYFYGSTGQTVLTINCRTIYF